MFKWFNPLNLMDTVQEWHAFVIGLADGMSFQHTEWHTMDIFYPESEKMEEEIHYYKGGVFFGRIAFIVLVAGMIVWII